MEVALVEGECQSYLSGKNLKGKLQGLMQGRGKGYRKDAMLTDWKLQ